MKIATHTHPLPKWTQAFHASTISGGFPLSHPSLLPIFLIKLQLPKVKVNLTVFYLLKFRITNVRGVKNIYKQTKGRDQMTLLWLVMNDEQEKDVTWLPFGTQKKGTLPSSHTLGVQFLLHCGSLLIEKHTFSFSWIVTGLSSWMRYALWKILKYMKCNVLFQYKSTGPNTFLPGNS